MGQRTNKELFRRKKLARKLITQALDGFYYFEDDDIENFIDKMDLRFWNHPSSRKMVRGAVMSNPVFNKIADVAEYIYGKEIIQ